MRIGVLSDSHGRLEYIDVAMEYLSDVDLIIHAGDNLMDGDYIEETYNIRVLSVAGNCDMGGIDEIIENIGGRTIFVTHGHQYLVSIDPSRLFYAAQERGAEIAIFGHTHKPFYGTKDGVTLINPGSVSQPRGNSERSFCIIDIGEDIGVDFINI